MLYWERCLLYLYLCATKTSQVWYGRYMLRWFSFSSVFFWFNSGHRLRTKDPHTYIEVGAIWKIACAWAHGSEKSEECSKKLAPSMYLQLYWHNHLEGHPHNIRLYPKKRGQRLSFPVLLAYRFRVWQWLTSGGQHEERKVAMDL